MGKTIQTTVRELPSPAELHRLAVANAACNQIKATRQPRFALAVRPDAHLLAFDNGGGDSALVVFSAAGVLLKGFDHESKASPYASGRIRDGVYAGLPTGLQPFVLEPEGTGDPAAEDLFPGELDGKAVELAPVTFAAWWSGGAWHHGREAAPEVAKDMAGDGSGWIVGALLDGTSHFVEDSYYSYDASVVEKIGRHEALADADIRKLDPAADVAAVRKRLEAVSYGAPVPFSFR